MPGNSKKIAIVEPHYDDAWLNLGGFILLHPQYEFCIISIAEDKKNRLNETEKLSKLLPNVQTFALHFQGIPWDFQGSGEEAIRKFCVKNSLNSLDDLIEPLEPLIAGCDEVILPLGMEHPQHYIVSQIPLQKSNAIVAFYREFPYFFPPRLSAFKGKFLAIQNKLYHAKTLKKRLCGLKAKKISIKSCLKQKLEILKDVYQSQSLLINNVRRGLRGAISISSLQDEVIFYPGERGSSVRLPWYRVFGYEFFTSQII